MPGIPERISVSQARLYEGCPKAFEYRYVTHLTVEDDHDPNRDFGRAVHAGLAAGYRLLMAASEPLSPAEANLVRGASIEALEDRWFAEGLSASEAYDEAHEHVLGEWNDETFERIPKRWRVTDVERGFRLTLPGEPDLAVTGGPGEPDLAVTGFLDLVLAHVSMPLRSIIDHKTGARLTSVGEMRDDDQLGLYGLAGLVLFPELPHPAEQSLLLGHNRTGLAGAERLLTFRPDLADLRRTQARLTRTRGRIEESAEANEWSAHPGRRCGWCSYRKTCPGALVLEYADLA